MAKKTFTGIVISEKMTNTVVVSVERQVKHPVYGKMLKRSGKIKADSSEIKPTLGQTVVIEQSRPLSADKHFKVIKIVKGEKSS